jgi:HSP20 family protein
VNIFARERRVMVSAPLPGMEPQNIRIDVHGRRVIIDTDQRGPRQERTMPHVRKEWTWGPYHRALELPSTVAVARANATYDNGVLVVIFPVSPRAETGRVSLSGSDRETAKGSRVGHRGRVRRASAA